MSFSLMLEIRAVSIDSISIKSLESPFLDKEIIIKEEELLADDLGFHRKQNAYYTGFNITKTIVGAGIFATPSAFESSGFWFGNMLVLLLGAIFYWSIMTLVKASVKSGSISVQQLMHFCFGCYGEIALNFSLIFITYGSIAAYSGMY